MIQEKLDPTLRKFIHDQGLVQDDDYSTMPLTGGVASDIWLIQTGAKAFVVKKALGKLRVSQDWQAPVSRNASEVEWMLEAGRLLPHAVPRILAHDRECGAFAMSYLDIRSHPVWKSELMAGRASPTFAAQVGETIARIHSGTAGRDAIASTFDHDDTFHALRLDPYLEATAPLYPDLAETFLALSKSVLRTKKALVHGDVSPKNLLVGPEGPIILDAECAWYGDPCFDLAFCLNHLLLKCIWAPKNSGSYLDSFRALSRAYLDNVDWEHPGEIEERTTALLPALTLARIDGKSPVEYITSEPDKRRVRKSARKLMEVRARTLDELAELWQRDASSHG